MVDVVSQYERYKSEIDASILSVLKSGIYIQGPEVEKFELLLSNYLHSKYTISCANGTDALYLALGLNLQQEMKLLFRHLHLFLLLKQFVY